MKTPKIYDKFVTSIIKEGRPSDRERWLMGDGQENYSAQKLLTLIYGWLFHTLTTVFMLQFILLVSSGVTNTYPGNNSTEAIEEVNAAIFFSFILIILLMIPVFLVTYGLYRILKVGMTRRDSQVSLVALKTTSLLSYLGLIVALVVSALSVTQNGPSFSRIYNKFSGGVKDWWETLTSVFPGSDDGLVKSFINIVYFSELLFIGALVLVLLLGVFVASWFLLPIAFAQRKKLLPAATKLGNDAKVTNAIEHDYEDLEEVYLESYEPVDSFESLMKSKSLARRVLLYKGRPVGFYVYPKPGAKFDGTVDVDKNYVLMDEYEDHLNYDRDILSGRIEAL